MWNVSMPIAYSNNVYSKNNNVNFKGRETTVAKKAVPYFNLDCKTDVEAFAHAVKNAFRYELEHQPKFLKEGWEDIIALPEGVWAGSSFRYSANDRFAHLPGGLQRKGQFIGPSGKAYAVLPQTEALNKYLSECHSRDGIIKLSDVAKEYEIGYNPLAIV